MRAVCAEIEGDLSGDEELLGVRGRGRCFSCRRVAEAAVCCSSVLGFVACGVARMACSRADKYFIVAQRLLPCPPTPPATAMQALGRAAAVVTNVTQDVSCFTWEAIYSMAMQVGRE